MAKQAKTAIKKSSAQSAETKNWTRVIRAVRNDRTGSYAFSESMVNKDKIKEYIESAKKKQ